jgi:Flp pilus assembly protein TadD
MVAQGHSELELAGLRFQIGIFEEALTANPDDTESLRFLSHGYAVTGRVEEGLAADRRLVELLPRDSRVRYNLACSCALTGRTEEAIRHLDEACDLGFDDYNLLSRDEDLDSLRDDVRYRELVARRFGK